MSFDLIAWKWAKGGSAKSNPKEVYERLLDDKEHPSVVSFDDKAVSGAILKEFGDVNGADHSPFMFFNGFRCLIFNVSADRTDASVPRLKKLLVAQNLFWYDPGSAA